MGAFRQGLCAFRLQHPAASSVVYLTGERGEVARGGGGTAAREGREGGGRGWGMSRQGWGMSRQGWGMSRRGVHSDGGLAHTRCARTREWVMRGGGVGARETRGGGQGRQGGGGEMVVGGVQLRGRSDRARPRHPAGSSVVYHRWGKTRE